jgi:7,8-dihydroneopterin aldolase/epimerase/oxygenase
MSSIILSGMKFYSHHGCFEEERVAGTRFVVDLTLECDLTHAAATDCIDDTVDYVSVYETVQSVMDEPVHLLETLAARIIGAIKEKFAGIVNVRVKICKLNPPLRVQTDFVAVEMEG